MTFKLSCKKEKELIILSIIKVEGEREGEKETGRECELVLGLRKKLE